MIQLIAAFSLSFLICYLAMPSIIRIAMARGIVDLPDHRKAHIHTTPSFGGLGIFAGFTLVMLVLTPADFLTEFRYMMAALVVMFLVGARDDLDPLTPWAKLVGQLVSIGLLVYFADIRLMSLHGLFGVYEISSWLSYTLSSVVFIFLINSFNLIDGIDGLCASISIFILTILGGWFALVDHAYYALVAFSAAGGTLAFLKYNISPSKVFMGDTGSLMLGTICSILVLKMLELNAGIISTQYAFGSALIIACGLLVLPAYDTIRVFLHRIIRGESPILPDKNHLHHLLLSAGLTHMESTALLLGVNVAFVLLALQCQSLSPTIFMVLMLTIAIALTMVLQLAIKYKRSQVMRTDP